MTQGNVAALQASWAAMRPGVKDSEVHQLPTHSLSSFCHDSCFEPRNLRATKYSLSSELLHICIKMMCKQHGCEL
jgi:hypothetical protein